MDKILTKEEKSQLLALLDLDGQYWGDFGRMQKAYHAQSLKFHPDKGGDPLLMQLLNTLWTKLKHGLHQVRLNLGGHEDVNPSTSRQPPEQFYNPETGHYWSFSYGSAGFSENQKKWWKEFFEKWERDLYCSEELGSSSEDDTPAPASPISISSSPPGSPRTPTRPGPSTALEPSPPSRKRVHANGPEHHGRKQLRRDQPPAPGGANIPGNGGRGAHIPEPDITNIPSDPAGGSQSTFGSYYNSTEELETNASEGEFQSSQTTPKKPPPNRHTPDDMPAVLRSFVSNAIYSNKTQNSFLIYTTGEKGTVLYDNIAKYNPDFKALFSFKGDSLLLIITPGKHRVNAVKSYCCRFCTVSFLLCKAVTKPLECYNSMSSNSNGFTLVKENKPGIYQFEFTDEKEEVKTVDWQLVTQFALENNLDDPLLIMGHYCEFAKDETTCRKCSEQIPRLRVHWKYHSTHANNADLFIQCKQQKSICQQAADNVLAKKRLRVLECTREELLADRFQKFLQDFNDLGNMDRFIYLAGVAWYNCLFTNFDSMLLDILKLFTENIPKKRNVLFKGPINSGKTSLAAAIMHLVGGVCLNVNCPSDKLNFELGCAIDKFACCFEDVKGQVANRDRDKDLQSGSGVSNLDNLRDHLDGSVKVNLEKKHVNKRSQIFPPCIVTANEYFFPRTLLARFQNVYTFTVQPHLAQALEKNPRMNKYRVCQSGLTLFMALLWQVPSDCFVPSLQDPVKDAKKLLSDMCGMTTFADMCLNIENGDDPLKGIVEEVEEALE
uniref:DNA 3'-5' helicase n=1 Tax=Rattus norvegicus polyomavirus 1 TaxID=1679933 RepID=A0A0H4PLB7_9POLY|nr:large T antigen [Rattus norvegicus polyomavirus 1]